METDISTSHINKPEYLCVSPQKIWHSIDKIDFLRTVFVAGCALFLGLANVEANINVFVAVIGLLIGCGPIAIEAWRDVLHKKMSMELSMLLAIVAAAVTGEWLTSLVISIFVLGAEILEDLSIAKGQESLQDLSFLPSEVQVREAQQVRSIPLSMVKATQLVVVPPGGRIPVDGKVVSGQSSVDQSRITGESLPVEIKEQDIVYAGSINQMGAIEIRADKVGENSSYGLIIETIRQAQTTSTPTKRLADRLASYLVYLALALAVMTYLFSGDLRTAISVIVVAGACGIAAGTPLAILATIARVARTGAFVKDGVYIEILAEVDTVIFDKTGTLTMGYPEVAEICVEAGISEKIFLSYLASAECYSEHPLGKAIVKYAISREIPVVVPDSFEYHLGLGVIATVNSHKVAAGNINLVKNATLTNSTCGYSVVHVSLDGKYIGSLKLADAIRPSASKAVTALKNMGLRVIMLTGDNEVVARKIASQLGITELKANLLPEDKLKIIDTEKSFGNKVLMIGDGINDAPALTRADTAIAIGSATELIRENSDVILLSSDLSDLVSIIKTSRRARRIVIFNFVGTVIIDLMGMALAAMGFLSPVLAAFIHVGSETAFILNSARLLPPRRKNNEIR